MPPAPNTIFTIAQTILQTVVDIYDDANISLPSRQYVSDGLQVAFDCELVSVALGRTYRGTASAPVNALTPQRCFALRTAEFHVWIVRCASTPQESGEAPTVATIESFAEPILTDAYLLPFGLGTAALSGDLGSPCDDILIGPLAITNQQGGYVGVDLTLEYQLGN